MARLLEVTLDGLVHASATVHLRILPRTDAFCN
jgi:hypothetical protein